MKRVAGFTDGLHFIPTIIGHDRGHWVLIIFLMSVHQAVCCVLDQVSENKDENIPAVIPRAKVRL